MKLTSNKVPGKVRSALRKGSTTVTNTVTGFTDVSRIDDTLMLVGYESVTPTTSGLSDTDWGIVPFADVIGGDMPLWPGTQFDACDDITVTAPLSRFRDAT